MSTLLFLNVYNIGDLSKLSIDNLKLLGYAFIIIFVTMKFLFPYAVPHFSQCLDVTYNLL